MTLHPAVGRDKKDQGESIGTRQCADQDKARVETTAQRLEQAPGPMGHKKAASPLLLVKQYGIAFGSIVTAILLRFIAEPYIGDSLPFVTFLLAVVVTTWWGGVGPSLMALILGGLLWNWFFVNPRYAFGMGNHVDQAGMAIYLTTGAAVIWYVQIWRWAWKQSEGTGKSYIVKAHGDVPQALQFRHRYPNGQIGVDGMNESATTTSYPLLPHTSKLPR
ncbi:membrane hypothetical protein [Candidatus Nitrospira nitrosa]|uniref:Sensor protein KdpD transmembrane domain-containing protein n=1 Tax=Candidatus Nitrospira nitrosa TaxID=1742972 RepID=A0A0S4LBR5_9BACT|nr:DUF4118 domain-containing protein [Candidatus Nitrospira nitrosa]CUS33284.1 membrane hypothetical protein [Candidatus Nitrospira nitrosa]